MYCRLRVCVRVCVLSRSHSFYPSFFVLFRFAALLKPSHHLPFPSLFFFDTYFHLYPAFWSLTYIRKFTRLVCIFPLFLSRNYSHLIFTHPTVLLFLATSSTTMSLLALPLQSYCSLLCSLPLGTCDFQGRLKSSSSPVGTCVP